MSENYPEGVTGDDVDRAYENRVWDEMQTPAARLLRAAELLEGRASEATEGPWTVGSALDMLSPPRTWHLEGVERWRGLTNNVQFGEDEATARYIATVHPGVGKLLAELLRGVTTGYASADAMMNDGWSPEARLRIIAANRPGLDQALALADLLLAGEQ